MYLLKTQNDPNPTKYLKTSKQISTFSPSQEKKTVNATEHPLEKTNKFLILVYSL